MLNREQIKEVSKKASNIVDKDNYYICMVSISHWGIFLIDWKYRGLESFRYG